MRRVDRTGSRQRGVAVVSRADAHCVLDRQNDVLTLGVSVARALTDRAEVVGEVNGRVSTRRGIPPPGTGSRGIMTVGLRYTRATVRIDGGLFAGLTALDARVGVTGGLTWVFESFLTP